MRRPPERLRWFALRLALLLVLAYLAWHFLESTVIHSLWRASDTAWPSLFRGGLVSVEPREQHWIIRTGWPIRVAPGAPAEQASTLLGMANVRRMLSGFPLLLALLLTMVVTTRGRRVRPVLLGLGAWWGVSWAAVSGYAWHLLAVLATGKASYVDANLVPPPFQLDVMPYPMWEFYLSGYTYYLAVLIVPVVSPLLIWAFVFRRDVRRLVIGLQRRYRRRRGA
jgi:hypothetical protein